MPSPETTTAVTAPGRAPGAPCIPLATYRLQFGPDLGFAAARALVPYLDALGVSHVYASSYLAARPGSRHGYDVVDHEHLNPELGTEAEYAQLAEALRARGLGQVLDVIPNHMGIGDSANRWWSDVLEHGPSSPYAEYFDIDWEPVRPELAHRVLLPILGDQYGVVLERAELVVEREGGGFFLRYHDARLPLDPASMAPVLARQEEALTAILGEADAALQEYRSILTGLRNLPARTETVPERIEERRRESAVIRRRLAELASQSEAVRGALDDALASLNGKTGDPRSFDWLDRLLDDQAYRLAYWRVAADEINYRRFFDVNELAAIRTERPAVFQATHRLVLGLVEDGHVSGLRIDHPDGLFDPAGYFLALQRERFAQLERARLHAGPPLSAPALEAAVAEAAREFEAACDANPSATGCRPLYVVAEKILARGERLPGRWTIHGTTGYEFLNLVGGLFVDPAGERPLTATYAAFTGRHAVFADLAYEAKQLILEVSMSSELSVLGHALDRLSERSRYSRDFTLNSLIKALREVIACFPVYRTYIDGRGEPGLQDRACVEVAVAFAKRRNPAISASVFDFVRDTLLLRAPEHADDAYRDAQRTFVQRLQQLTAPVMAKGVEDTTFYRYHRLVSLNEVGGDPERFGVSVEEFHRQCAARQAEWPAGLSTTSTHDTKRGEDVRARISVLSELPRGWRAAVRRWHRRNQALASRVDGAPVPDREDEYLFYQTLVGAWPAPTPGPSTLADFAGRVEAYMLKAAREAKRHTSWISPNESYEAALRRFVRATLDGDTARRFLDDFETFHAPVARLGAVNGLAQTLLKLTAPGVPDFYQGTELWDWSLVDPDNRRPVDWGLRQTLLAGIEARIHGGDLGRLAAELIERWPDGRVKLYLIRRALACRRAAPEIFREGRHLPLTTTGPAAGRLCAFARQLGDRAIVAVAPRLVAPLTDGGTRWPLGPAAWSDTAVLLPPDLAVAPRRDVFTGASPVPDGRGALRVASLLADFPVALLIPETLEVPA